MRFSVRGRLAVSVMVDVALREASGPVSLTGVAARQAVSLSYVEQLFSRLRQHGLVVSTRGPGGGYCIGGPLDRISVKDIVCAVEEDAEEVPPLDPVSVHFTTQRLWEATHAKVLECMQAISLCSLVREQLDHGFSMAPTARLKHGIFKQPEQLSCLPSVPNSVFALGGLAAAHAVPAHP
jgi:Rrf2 family iron-sulfur cluster assembly transcriptional regulator